MKKKEVIWKEENYLLLKGRKVLMKRRKIMKKTEERRGERRRGEEEERENEEGRKEEKLCLMIQDSEVWEGRDTCLCVSIMSLFSVRQCSRKRKWKKTEEGGKYHICLSMSVWRRKWKVKEGHVHFCATAFCSSMSHCYVSDRKRKSERKYKISNSLCYL